jgi:hypothetical protein
VLARVKRAITDQIELKEVLPGGHRLESADRGSRHIQKLIVQNETATCNKTAMLWANEFCRNYEKQTSAYVIFLIQKN